jgi:succinyl-diaminopimelate desuccinylase
MSEELILKEIETNKEEYIEFFRELIKTESYNPPGNEKNVALKIEEFLKESNIKCEIFPFGENRANLIAYLNDQFENKNILYNGHMDVVPPGNVEDWKYPPLSATIKRNKLYGRGTTDMKGALAAMIIALKILKKLGLKLSGNLIVNAVADEERGGKFGTGWCKENILKARSIKCDFIVIGEPSGLNPLPKAIVLGEKGSLNIKIITNGISAHSMVPSMGKNAIYMMSDIIQNLDELEDFIPRIDPPISLEKLKEMMSSAFPSEEIFNRIYNEQPLMSSFLEALTQFTKSLTLINGGIKENIIPDRCEAFMNFRLLPGQTSEIIIKGLKKLINHIGYEVREDPKAKPEDIFVYLEIPGEGAASIWRDYEASQTLKDFKAVIEKIYKIIPFYALAPGSTDAHYYRNDGYCKETINFGPGNAARAHTVDEYIEIEDFINAIKVYTLFAYNFLK